jgi:MYXO-CTERM domain-containing protein
VAIDATEPSGCTGSASLSLAIIGTDPVTDAGVAGDASVRPDAEPGATDMAGPPTGCGCASTGDPRGTLLVIGAMLAIRRRLRRRGS